MTVMVNGVVIDRLRWECYGCWFQFKTRCDCYDCPECGLEMITEEENPYCGVCDQ